MAAVLAEINRNADALVAVIFDGFDCSSADSDCLPETFRHIRFACTGAAPMSVVQHVGRNLPQLRAVMRENFGAQSLLQFSTHGNIAKTAY